MGEIWSNEWGHLRKECQSLIIQAMVSSDTRFYRRELMHFLVDYYTIGLAT